MCIVEKEREREREKKNRNGREWNNSVLIQCDNILFVF